MMCADATGKFSPSENQRNMTAEDERSLDNFLDAYIANSQKIPLHPIEELALSTRGRGFIIDRYVYVRDKERPGKIYVRCQDRKICQARAVIFPELNRARVMATSHTHDPPNISQLMNRRRFATQRRNFSGESTLRMRTKLYMKNSLVDNTRRSRPTNPPMSRAFEARVVPMGESDEYSVDVQIEEKALLASFRRNANSQPSTSSMASVAKADGKSDDMHYRKPYASQAQFGQIQDVAGPSSGVQQSRTYALTTSDNYEPYEDGFIPEDEDGFEEQQLKPVALKKVEVEANNSEGDDTSTPYTTERHRPAVKEFQRTRSINAPIPSPSFGPKACLKKVPPSQMMHVTDPSSQKLIWTESPLTVLVIKKIMDVTVLEPFKELAKYLIEEKQLIVYVESKVLEEPDLVEDKEFDQFRLKMKTFKDGDKLGDRIDFIVCLGGDGTLLYASSLFQEGTVPPVIAFHLGSFGFLTTYEFTQFREAITVLLEGNTPVTLRSRLKCLIFEDENIPSDLDRENYMAIKPVKVPDPPNLKFKWECLNEVVIDRGSSPYLSNLDLYLDDRHITTVQGDGLIISTPTGSTAYAAAAGASMIHPNVPAILITPICPHTLSFRPIVVPAGVELKVTVSPDARHTAWVSLDGKHRQEIHKGWCLRITNSVFPVASVCSVDQIVDWFDSLVACMHWNEREQQKSFRPRERLRKTLPSNNNLEKLAAVNNGSGSDKEEKR